MEKEKDIPRQRWIDIYKGIAIVLVVLGHLRIPQGLYRFIFMFHMYAFFFVGGVTYRCKTNVPFLRCAIDAIRQLYIPYLVYAGLWLITELALGLYEGQALPTLGAIGKNLVNAAIGGGVIPGCTEVGPAWFLCALLVVRLIYDAVARLSRNNLYILGTLGVICFVLAYFLEGRAGLPLRFVQSLSAFVFFFAGDLCKPLCAFAAKSVGRAWGAFTCVTGAVAAFGIVLWMSLLTDKALVLGGNILPSSWVITIAGGLGGCLGLVCLSVLMQRIGGSSRMLAFFGCHSMIVMGLHSEIRMVLYLVLEKVLKLSSWALELPVFVLSLGICAPVAWVIGRHVPVLVGKKKDILSGMK